jgi:transcriptional regulator with XRE-family HTH domain
METIGIRLKKIRQKENLNQRDFAKRIGISQGMLSGIENGTEKFSSRTQKIVCFEFGIEENWLLTGQEPMFISRKAPPEAIQRTDGMGLTVEERELLEIYDKLTANTQKDIRDYLQEKLELQELRKKNSSGEASPASDFPLEPIRRSTTAPDADFEEDRTVG